MSFDSNSGLAITNTMIVVTLVDRAFGKSGKGFQIEGAIARLPTIKTATSGFSIEIVIAVPGLLSPSSMISSSAMILVWAQIRKTCTA
jgi:hypothetical protein